MKSRSELEERQSRAAKAVWGLIAITMGVLFMLNNLGTIHMGRSPFPARYAVDGDPKTRWASEFSAPQTLAVDLGVPTEISRVRLNWERAFARDYELQVSNDNASWTTIADIKDGDGAIDDLTVSGRGRYVRVHATRRDTGFGVSLWEMEVYSGGELVSQDRKVAASSLEEQSYWLLYWPVTLIGTGLPLLLAPRDPGHFAAGLVLTGLGVFFQLRTLDLVPWSFGESLPVALILLGLVLVIQSWHRSQQPDEARDGSSGSTGGAL